MSEMYLVLTVVYALSVKLHNGLKWGAESESLIKKSARNYLSKIEYFAWVCMSVFGKETN